MLTPWNGEIYSIVYSDAGEMDDSQVISEIDLHELRVSDIIRQLDDDKKEGIVKGESWRARANTAKRARQSRIDQLVAEAKKRNIGKYCDDKQRKDRNRLQQLELERLAHENKQAAIHRHEQHIQLQKQAAQLKLELARIANERSESNAQSFVRFAQKMLPKEEYASIWAAVNG